MHRPGPTDPLRIDALPLAGGWLGLAACPGRRDGAAPRELEADLCRVAGWGAGIVVSLAEAAELAALGVPGLGAAVQARGIAWAHLPIRDYGVPDAAGEAAWAALSPRLHRVLEGGGRVLLHCRGGLGRSGTMAACLLVERGETPERAIARVRAARPGAVETAAQERWLAARGPDRGR